MGQGPTRYLPQVALATFAVAGLPALIVSGLQAAVRLPAIPAIVLAMLLSVLIARLCAAIWMRRPGSRDIVFGDLMVWGWLRRMRAERRLAEAEELLGSGALPLSRRAELLKTLAAGLEARDAYTHGHSNRVARYSEAIARAMGLSREQVAKVRTAAAVHDVGKIRTPRAILTKPGRLDDPELAVMQRHVRDGAEMVSGLGDPEITAMVMGHHERLDGSGYPGGLPDEQISLGARIIAVADTFDAMTSSRPYRSAAPHKRAMDTLVAESPVRLDGRAVAAFRNYYSGERAVPVSAFLTTAPQRLGAWVAALLQGEGAVPLAQGLSALGAAALMGSGAMIGSAVNEQGTSSQRAAVTSKGADTATLDGSPTGSDRARGGVGTRHGGRRRGLSRPGTPGGRGQSHPNGGTPSAPQQGPGRSRTPSPSPAQPSPPHQPGRTPGGGIVKPTLSITPEQIHVEAKVDVPQVLPLPPVDTNLTVDLPALKLPRS
ncbi:MAG TPA: HD-GYP domain-containing protein [Thermoleophilaceae bacterium]